MSMAVPPPFLPSLQEWENRLQPNQVSVGKRQSSSLSAIRSFIQNDLLDKALTLKTAIFNFDGIWTGFLSAIRLCFDVYKIVHDSALWSVFQTKQAYIWRSYNNLYTRVYITRLKMIKTIKIILMR